MLFTDEFQTDKIRKCIVPNVCTTVVIHYTVVLFKVFFQIRASSQAISYLYERKSKIQYKGKNCRLCLAFVCVLYQLLDRIQFKVMAASLKLILLSAGSLAKRYQQPPSRCPCLA